MSEKEKALQILRKYENRPTGYDEDEIINAMIEFSESQCNLKINNGSVDASNCVKCYDTGNFYLGSTCSKCNRPFRNLKA